MTTDELNERLAEIQRQSQIARDETIKAMAHAWAETLLALPTRERVDAIFGLGFQPGFYPFLRRAIREQRERARARAGA